MDGSRSVSPAGTKIVEAAEDLFYGRGITAVGVDLIAERSGVTKRTLYNQFGSKDELVRIYLTGRDERWRSAIRTEIEASDDPTSAVTAPFAVLGAWLEESRRGCAFVNALAELPDSSHPAHHIAVDQKRWLKELFGQLATEAGIPEPERLATQLFVLHEGILASTAVSIDTLDVGTRLARSLVLANTEQRD